MNIGIVTIIDGTNYGNRLQNYALSRVLREKGHRAVTLVPHEERAFENGNFPLWLKTRAARLLCSVFPWAGSAGMRRWVNFTRGNAKIPMRHFYGCAVLPRGVDADFDAFIAGSDQIWNCRIAEKRFDDFFLRFAAPEKRIAVSASFGMAEIPSAWEGRIAEGLAGFRAISVREEAGRDIVRALTGQDVPVLIDPTMLLTAQEWEKCARKPRVDCEKPYVLTCFLGEDAERARIDAWAGECGSAVYALNDRENPALYSAGPAEFLYLVRHAAFVCTDSYHAAVFAILFQRPFAVCARRGAEDYMESRLDTLLKTFRLEGRRLEKMQNADFLTCDLSHTERILDRERRRFSEYLDLVLQGGIAASL